ncbi:hypothetical protein [Deinococcus sp. 23YEL01]|uniref:hypothetical protein n=1 Tax=Deinococcus sp. 23YEL01 TaxID=2745871 RepID=UPI001E34A172|nr:hypothetical protein [Deinococcus sp. 23YEL01]MCD0168041.1 hypothetical protein [Deinococcus sp. 23YEL01]
MNFVDVPTWLLVPPVMRTGIPLIWILGAFFAVWGTYWILTTLSWLGARLFGHTLTWNQAQVRGAGLLAAGVAIAILYWIVKMFMTRSAPESLIIIFGFILSIGLVIGYMILMSYFNRR